MILRTIIAVAMAITAGWANRAGAESRCFGTVGNGRIEGSVALPAEGPNFVAYSDLAIALGRTYVHSRASEIIVAAYAALAQADPGTVYVYGETGLSSGGRIRPHRTHQNGTSVDFFVPVRNAGGRSVPLPTSVINRWGYDIEFDDAGAWGSYRIDFAAIAEHLYQLDAAARKRGSGLALVIFEPTYLSRLYATPRAAWVRAHVRFLPRPAWVRHDEHYHVDFDIPCRPYSP
jgi:penicillin-insensitive murein endopeptidase